MDKGTIVILERDEDPRDFPVCDEALVVVRMSGEILKDRMGIFIRDNVKVLLRLTGGEASTAD